MGIDTSGELKRLFASLNLSVSDLAFQKVNRIKQKQSANVKEFCFKAGIIVVGDAEFPQLHFGICLWYSLGSFSPPF